MKQTLPKLGFLVGLMIILLPFSRSDVLSAQVNTMAADDNQGQNSSEDYLPSEKALKRIRFLQNLKDQLSSSNRDYRVISDNLIEANERLEQIQTKVSSLRDQLESLDQQIEVTGSLIGNVENQIVETKNELILLYSEMELERAAIEQQKKLLSEYLNVLYEQENSMTDTLGGNKQINLSKLLLSDISVGEQLQQLKYFNIMEDTGHDIFGQLEQMYIGLLANERTAEIKKARLEALNDSLQEEKRNLEAEQLAKIRIMVQTKGQEKIYQEMVAQSRTEQEMMQADSRTLRDNLAFIEQKMIEQGDSFNPDDYLSLFDRETTSVAEYIRNTNGNDSGFVPLWPVSPARGISAYFRDGGYRRVFGFTHNAIDIRVPQGTPISAPASGVVYKVRDNGFGYSYLILAHEGGFMTVYGHVSEFRVLAGEKVMAGQIIGLSGGIPGSKGAGLMTTGAHLHFEVMKGGKYVDPLDYMPLSLLPISTLPDKYLSRVTGDDRKVKRLSDDIQSASNDSELTELVEQNGIMDQVILNKSGVTREVPQVQES